MAETTEKFNVLSKYLVMRLEGDPQLGEKIKSDPIAELKLLGFDEEMFVDESGATADQCTCYDTTCFSSQCPATCLTPSVTWTPNPTMLC